MRQAEAGLLVDERVTLSVWPRPSAAFGTTRNPPAIWAAAPAPLAEEKFDRENLHKLSEQVLTDAARGD